MVGSVNESLDRTPKSRSRLPGNGFLAVHKRELSGDSSDALSQCFFASSAFSVPSAFHRFVATSTFFDLPLSKST